MLNDNRYTDKKLQELEKQSLPDLSKMDEHWQQMKTFLQPAVIPVKKKTIGRKRIIGWVIAAAFIGAVAVLGYKMINPKNASTTVVNHGTDGSAGKPGTSNDNVSSGQSSKTADKGSSKSPVSNSLAPTNTSPVNPAIAKSTAKRSKPRQVKDKGTAYQKQVVLSQPLETYLKDSLSGKHTSAAEAKAMLSNFFKQLEKPAEQFTVSNKRDTIITGRDGTALLIPAYAFAGTDEVVITMKEYYSYQDIVTNKLSTLADNEQLITGGMLHLMATVNGKEVDLQPGKSIRWFIPDTTPAMVQMQLFNGVATSVELNKKTKFMEGDGPRDTMPSYVRYNNINWIAQSRSFAGSYLYTGVRVLDLRDDPFKTHLNQRGKRTGFFFIAPNSELNKRELAEALKEKYGYDKVKIRKSKHKRYWSGIYDSRPVSQELGDSAWMDIREAQTYRLPASDTMVSISTGGMSRITTKSKGYNAYKALFNEISKNDLSKRYSVDIRTMGWVNCDRFYKEGPKIDYYVDIKDTAANYFTVLVFKNIRSMMSGSVYGNRVMFGSVPIGQEAKIISVGIQNGKTVLAVKDVVLSAQAVNGLVFEPTTPSAFKQEVGTMDE